MQLLSDLFPAPPPLHWDAAAVKIHRGWGSCGLTPGCCLAFWRPVQGPELPGNELSGLPEEASALPAHRAGVRWDHGGRGRWGRTAGAGNAPTALLSRTFTWRKSTSTV